MSRRYEIEIDSSGNYVLTQETKSYELETTKREYVLTQSRKGDQGPAGLSFDSDQAVRYTIRIVNETLEHVLDSEAVIRTIENYVVERIEERIVNVIDLRTNINTVDFRTHWDSDTRTITYLDELQPIAPYNPTLSANPSFYYLSSVPSTITCTYSAGPSYTLRGTEVNNVSTSNGSQVTNTNNNTIVVTTSGIPTSITVSADILGTATFNGVAQNPSTTRSVEITGRYGYGLAYLDNGTTPTADDFTITEASVPTTINTPANQEGKDLIFVHNTGYTWMIANLPITGSNVARGTLTIDGVTYNWYRVLEDILGDEEGMISR